MKTTLAWTTATLIAVAAIAGAQDTGEKPAAKPPFAWKISGETAEEFKAEFVSNHKADQSTPTLLVETYAAYTDSRDELKPENDRVSKMWQDALNRSMAKMEAVLLTDEAVKAMQEEAAKSAEKNEKDATYISKRQPMKVVSETDGADGSKIVETTQSMHVRQKKWGTEEWTEETTENKFRFTCIRGDDGKWRIERVEAWRRDWEGAGKGGEAKYTWQEESSMLAFLYYMREEVKKWEKRKLPEAAQDTPRNAATAIFATLMPSRQRLEERLVLSIHGWFEAMEALVTDGFKKATAGKVLESSKKVEEKEEPAREIESETDGEGGIKIIKFKPRYEWGGAIEMHMKQVDGKWKLAKAGVWEKDYNDKGEPEQKFAEQANIYSLRYR
ncbi:MAG: hypothetical protein IT464_14730 [Planctomycetes bacterium]|nr:hypothetical protein [Planctomycetota bacterium]